MKIFTGDETGLVKCKILIYFNLCTINLPFNAFCLAITIPEKSEYASPPVVKTWGKIDRSKGIQLMTILEKKKV
jgi:hypothetical protein